MRKTQLIKRKLGLCECKWCLRIATYDFAPKIKHIDEPWGVCTKHALQIQEILDRKKEVEHE